MAAMDDIRRSVGWMVAMDDIGIDTLRGNGKHIQAPRAHTLRRVQE